MVLSVGTGLLGGRRTHHVDGRAEPVEAHPVLVV